MVQGNCRKSCSFDLFYAIGFRQGNEFFASFIEKVVEASNISADEIDTYFLDFHLLVRFDVSSYFFFFNGKYNCINF